jgi:ribosomal protein S12 methylthiotransferase accessory factor YcaO
MISIAPVSYRSVFAGDHGPIESVVCNTTDSLGQPLFQANAFLSPTLVPAKQRNGIFGNADGTGTHASQQVARHMAISEALERWAYWTISTGQEAERYGFTVDRTTTGMAAFPGLFRSSARRLALFEAMERWALASWWLGQLEGTIVSSFHPGVTAVRIETGLPVAVALAFRRSPAGQVSYGYAAAANFRSALQRAMIEMSRNEFVFSYTKLRGGTASPLTAFEQRCLYFASPEGHERFLQRLFSRRRGTQASWSVLFDGEIPGPWSQYATVWRVVPAMPADYANEGYQFFAW